MEIEVMTYNIHHGMGMYKQLDLSRIAEVIEKSDVDIIGINEVDRYFSRRSDYEDQINWLAKQLHMHSAFGPSLSLKSNNLTTVRQYGNALLSRYSIIDQKNHQFNFILGLIERRSLLETNILINNNVFQINVSHLSLNPFLHRKQIDFIVDQYDHSHPMIIMGDCNMRPRSKGWYKMSNKFHDAWKLAGTGNGYTYPSIRPRLKLDYIFVSPNIQVIKTEVVTKNPIASDHLPLKATLSCSY